MAEKFLKTSSMKKFNQLELRKLIQEQSTKTQKAKVVVERIESPLAKYDSAGNLSCLICKTQIKPNVWKVHINSKQHKQKSEASKAIVEKAVLQNGHVKPTSTPSTSVVKKSAEEVKGSVTNSEKTNTSTTREVSRPPVNEVKNALAGTTPQFGRLATEDSSGLDKVLPEEFFDKPKDKADPNNDPFESEWSRFQKEIKEETSVSYQIEAGQQENAAIEREIEEIDDQLKRWKKVVEFENKTAEVLCKRAGKKPKESDDSDEDMDDEDIPESLLDLSQWRAKKL